MSCHSNKCCDPCPPCETQLPATCEPLGGTTEAAAIVVEDTAFCKKTISGTEGQIPRVESGLIGFVDATPLAIPNSLVSRNSNGDSAFSRIDSTEVHVNNPSGDTRVEVGGSGDVYLDLKNPNSDDYDLRIQASGTDPRILTDNAKLLIDATDIALQSITNGNVGIGTNAPIEKLEVVQSQPARTSARAFNSDSSPSASAGYLAQQGSIIAEFLASGDAELKIGTQTSHPVIFQCNSANRMAIATTGNVGIGTTTPQHNLHVIGSIISTTQLDGIGYGVGAGGTVTQLTSRTTPVTINNICGSITMFSAAGSTTAATFTVNNSSVGINDTIILNQRSGSNLYDLMVTAVAAGSFNITFRTTGGTATDAPVINFTVIKSATT
jgi:hypothetical protein